MKTYGSMEVELHQFLTSELHGGERSGSVSDRFATWEIAQGNQSLRGDRQSRPRHSSGKRKNFRP
jgi:hypothetical protein